MYLFHRHAIEPFEGLHVGVVKIGRRQDKEMSI